MNSSAKVVSLYAYRSINKKALQQKVLDYVTGAGFYGTTTDEAEEALGLAHQTVSPRMGELRDLGLIYATGDKRLTRSGRKAEVYCATRVVALQELAVAA